MRISGLPPLPPAVSHQPRAAARPQATEPATGSGAPEPEAPAETGRAHGLVRAGEHSHRSDVAALRQWVNHPELRNDLALPDLAAEHKGNGFARAVAAYEAAIAAGTPDPVTTDPPTV